MQLLCVQILGSLLVNNLMKLIVGVTIGVANVVTQVDVVKTESVVKHADATTDNARCVTIEVRLLLLLLLFFKKCAHIF